MRIDLEKSLIKNKRRLLSKEEVLALDKMSETSGVDSLKAKLGMWKDNTKIVEAANKKVNTVDRFQSDRVFQLSDIEKLCCKYGLRFLSSQYFNGNLDTELPIKIKEFEERYNIQVDHKNSFIAAPASNFKLSRAPKDPLFFVEVDKTNKLYYLVHKWGNDISIWRFVGNFFLRTPFHMFISMMMICFGVSIRLSSNIDFFGGSSFIGIMIGSLVSIISMLIIGNNVSFNNDYWDQPYKK